MKVIVRNLGVLKEEATIDIKPLTIFIGPNNSGKTWLAYALSGIFGLYGSREYIRAYTEKQVPTIYEELNDAIERVLVGGNATIDLHQFANDYAEMYFNAVAKFAQNWMSIFLSTQFARFDDLDISLSLEETKAYILKQVTQYSQRSNIAIGSKGSLLTIQKKTGEDKLYVFTSSELQDAEEQETQIGEFIPVEVIRERLVSFVSTVLRRSLYPQVRIFPTERTTFVAFRFGRRIAGREQPKFNEKVIEALELLEKELDTRPLIEHNTIREAIWPVGSFLSMLSRLFNISLKDRQEREKNAQNEPLVRKYIQLAETLEKQILEGSIDFSTPEPDPRREVLFQPAQDVNLEIPIASSMAKELSPLVLYLRDLARPGELLIIDEPEMNLHPRAQAKIIEFLTMLVNAGLNVLITTHSPYITDHLTNLIKAEQSENQGSISNEFYLKSSSAFIAKDKVSVYGISEGKVKNVLDDDGMINWSTFGDVSEHISDIFFKL
ncbi:MAG: AAA family ATPase [Ktedonobacteraceae bacterium]